jgi:hypothetical protein
MRKVMYVWRNFYSSAEVFHQALKFAVVGKVNNDRDNKFSTTQCPKVSASLYYTQRPSVADFF